MCCGCVVCVRACVLCCGCVQDAGLIRRRLLLGLDMRGLGRLESGICVSGADMIATFQICVKHRIPYTTQLYTVLLSVSYPIKSYRVKREYFVLKKFEVGFVKFSHAQKQYERAGMHCCCTGSIPAHRIGGYTTSNEI